MEAEERERKEEKEKKEESDGRGKRGRKQRKRKKRRRKRFDSTGLRGCEPRFPRGSWPGRGSSRRLRERAKRECKIL